jgi:hypothetical protein
MTKSRKTAAAPRPVAVPTPVPEPVPFNVLGPDDTHELNPRIVDEIEHGQRAALEVAAYRLDEYPAETVRRLVGLALFLTGLDPASEDEAEDALRKILGDDEEVSELLGRLFDLESRFRDLSVKRERLDRAAFLNDRKADLDRLNRETKARVAAIRPASHADDQGRRPRSRRRRPPGLDAR